MVRKKKMVTNNPHVVNKSSLVACIRETQTQLSQQDVEMAVSSVLSRMKSALIDGERIEIRGFGTLALRYRRSRLGRNPRVGNAMQIPEKYTPGFKASEKLRARMNNKENKLS